MIIERHQPVIAGRKLHRLILSPEDEAKGGLLFFHGQGDFIDRYPPLLEGFVEAGYQCLLTDLPGHGHSPGRRGVVPGLAFVDALFEDSLQQLNGPLIIAGHSMGGLLALRFFLRHPEKFKAAWISSPLLDPMLQAAPWMKKILPIASRILPWATVTTGVKSEDCGDMPDGRGPEENEILYHSRISIGWGRDLRDAAEEVKRQFPSLPNDCPILFTQGKRDQICPPGLLKDRLQELPDHQITFELIPEARHEPFSGSTESEFFEKLTRWIEGALHS